MNHFKLPIILVVAQDLKIRRWVKKYLDDKFFIVYAENQKEAASALNIGLSFIIIDSELESSDPIELASKLHPQASKNMIPIFLITGRLKKSYRKKAKNAGVTEFLSSSLDLEELLLKIESGKKAVTGRAKTEKVTQSIKGPNLKNSSESLKHKFVLDDKAIQLISKAKKENVPIALLFMRIDQKNFSEPSFKELSSFLRSLIRERDLLLPSPDKGLALLLYQTTLSQAKIIAERIQEKIKTHPFENEALSVSIALSSFDASEKGLSAMLTSATKSLEAHQKSNLIISLDQEIL